jgi:AcrR family transcriptional regulator
MSSAKTSKRIRSNDRPPRGKAEIMEAVLSAATRLFGLHGPGSVSVRDIARDARINHALVHRHFGSKQAVFDMVLERTFQRLASIANEIVDVRSGARRLFEAGLENRVHLRIIARGICDGIDYDETRHRYPVIDRLIELLEQKRGHADTMEIRVQIGCMAALVMGWLLYEPILLRSTRLDQIDRADVSNKIIGVLGTMIDYSLRGKAPSRKQRRLKETILPVKLVAMSSSRLRKNID